MKLRTKTKIYNKQIKKNNLQDKRLVKRGNKRKNNLIVLRGFKVVGRKASGWTCWTT